MTVFTLKTSSEKIFFGIFNSLWPTSMCQSILVSDFRLKPAKFEKSKTWNAVLIMLHYIIMSQLDWNNDDSTCLPLWKLARLQSNWFLHSGQWPLSIDLPVCINFAREICQRHQQLLLLLILILQTFRSLKTNLTSKFKKWKIRNIYSSFFHPFLIGQFWYFDTSVKVEQF